MSLFDPEDDEAPDPKSEPFDVIQANLLREAIIESTHRVCGWSRSSWANEFRKLRGTLLRSPTPEDGRTYERVTKVLDWYCRNVGKEMVPQAFCANSFRRKFDRIEAAMRRDQRDHPDVFISALAQDIAEGFHRWTWPKDSEKDLPAVIQISLDNYHKFLHKLTKFVLDSPKDSNTLRGPSISLARVGGVFYDEHRDARHFVETWITWVHGRIKDWDDWNGPLARWAFTPDHAQFHRMGAGWAAKYGDVRLWGRLMEALK